MNNSDRLLAVALQRVSSDKQFYLGDSIDTQKNKIDMLAERDNSDIVRYFVELDL